MAARLVCGCGRCGSAQGMRMRTGASGTLTRPAQQAHTRQAHIFSDSPYAHALPAPAWRARTCKSVQCMCRLRGPPHARPCQATNTQAHSAHVRAPPQTCSKTISLTNSPIVTLPPPGLGANSCRTHTHTQRQGVQGGAGRGSTGGEVGTTGHYHIQADIEQHAGLCWLQV